MTKSHKQAICLILGFLVLKFAVADEGPGPSLVFGDSIKKSTVSVIASDAVSNEVGKLPARDKVRVTAAIEAGSAYLKLYLDAVACLSDYPDYDDQMSRFVDNPENIGQICSRNSLPQQYSGGGVYTVRRVVCPRTLLQAVKLNNGEVLLTYETTEVGAITEYSATGNNVFNAEESGKKLAVAITVSSRNKVRSFSVDDSEDQEVYGRTLAALPYALKATAEQVERQAIKVCK